MNSIKQPALALSALLLLAACGGGHQADKGRFKKAITEYAKQEKVCLPVSLAVDSLPGGEAVGGLLGAPQIRVVTENIQGDRINKQALKQMDTLVRAGLYHKGEKETQPVGVDGTSVPVTIFKLSEKGQAQVEPGAHGPALCLGTQKVADIEMFTEPTPANGVTVSRVVYTTTLVPEKWVSRLARDSSDTLTQRIKEPQRRQTTLVLTNKGWRDLRELR
ncbi:hypothetical protein L1281_002314 [Neisseria sp. HSC-16F19]|nr:hypothetical protein [Neisseria sp. HSC-16F19]MCP2041703.1 hypothetical protein [Neisseria sp. HSC-16F19]